MPYTLVIWKQEFLKSLSSSSKNGRTMEDLHACRFCARWQAVARLMSVIQKDLLHEFIDKTICIILRQILIVCCCNCWALTLRTVCLNTEWAKGVWHSWLKHLNCWWKTVKNLICYSCIFNVQVHVHLKKWSLKFKLLYLSNCISYFNKICTICYVNTHIQNLKVWLKSVLPWMKYSIFF